MTHEPDQQAAARRLLAKHITLAIRAAQLDHPSPMLLAHEAPSVLAILAGTSVLQLVRSQVLGDGEGDQMLAGMLRDMRAASDPSLNPPTGSEVSASMGRRLRAWLKGGRDG